MKPHTEESWEESHGEVVCFLDKAPGTSRARLLSSFPLAHVNDFSFCESQFELSFDLIALKHLTDIAEQRREFT